MRFFRRLAPLAGLALLLLTDGPTGAQPRQVRLRYSFQPDCYRPSLQAPCDRRKTGTSAEMCRLDLGPQIAVWVESADGSRFIDTLLVTNGVANRGLGNRPGRWDFGSSPKFPYGKRSMALPVWAVRRGKLYEQVVMQDGQDRESWLGFHESISSPDPFYCRPMAFSEIDVDAITCPTTVFNSAKGKLSKTEPKSYYPPRNDLRMFIDRDCDTPGQRTPGCALSASTYADLNDLDAVATATPPYGRPFTGTWTVPVDVPDGSYTLFVEISKEFDRNGSHDHPAFTDPNLTDSGCKTNLGQPSVVYQVPFSLSRTVGFQGAAADITGYGDWDGKTGALHPPDGTITSAPGSGRARFLSIAQDSMAGGSPIVGRVHVSTDSPFGPRPDGGTDDAGGVGGADGGGGDPCGVRTRAQATDVTVPTPKAESAVVHFLEATRPAFDAVEGYQVRVWEGSDATNGAFDQGTVVDSTLPRVGAAAARTVMVGDLKGEKMYTVGVKPFGACVDGVIAYASFMTETRQFKTLGSGCFIATAAYGTPQAMDVDVLRRARDRARDSSAFAAAAVALYERSSPPLAGLLGETDGGRAAVRRALAPLIELLKVAP